MQLIHRICDTEQGRIGSYLGVSPDCRRVVGMAKTRHERDADSGAQGWLKTVRVEAQAALDSRIIDQSSSIQLHRGIIPSASITTASRCRTTILGASKIT